MKNKMENVIDIKIHANSTLLKGNNFYH